MAGTRENIFVNTGVRNGFLEGMVLLDQTPAGVTASDLFRFIQNNNLPINMRGIEQDLTIYDIFVFWHLVAMRIPLQVGNMAHGGPIFLPWHRMYLIRLEEMLQQVLDDVDFALPYWNWADDGELPTTQQWRADLWTPAYLGESRGTVRTGVLADMRVRLVEDSLTRDLVSIAPRALQRQAGFDTRVPNLPNQSDVTSAMTESVYDESPWSVSAGGFRNTLEGWVNGPALHNRVHVWIGGDMGPGTSPNDPVFFLNHCFVDRVWENWMINRGRVYEPTANRGPQGHRIDSSMLTLIGETLTPSDVLDPREWYHYDSFIFS